jgi:hypothetical protein
MEEILSCPKSTAEKMMTKRTMFVVVSNLTISSYRKMEPMTRDAPRKKRGLSYPCHRLSAVCETGG